MIHHEVLNIGFRTDMDEILLVVLRIQGYRGTIWDKAEAIAWRVEEISALNCAIFMLDECDDEDKVQEYHNRIEDLESDNAELTEAIDEMNHLIKTEADEIKTKVYEAEDDDCWWDTPLSDEITRLEGEGFL